MIEDALVATFIFAPAAIANGTPVVAAKLPGLSSLNQPLDFGRSWRGKRVFGPNKTWRGLISGIVAGGAAGLVQQAVLQHSSSDGALRSVYDTIDINIVCLGMALGTAALIGDAAKSFIKRQRGVPSGQSFAPFDQIDYVLAGLLVLTAAGLDSKYYVYIFVIYSLLHPIAAHTAYRLHLRKDPF